MVFERWEDFDSYLQSYDALKEVKFAPGLSTLRIHIEGDRYDGELPVDLARGLCQLQDQIYSVAAMSIYGDPKHRLTTGEKERFQLSFKVENGSINLSEDLNPVFSSIVTEAFSKMTPTQITILLGLIVAGYVGYRMWDSWLSHKTEIQTKSIEAEKDKSRDQQETERLKVIDRILSRHAVDTYKAFSSAGEEAEKIILKSAMGATKVEIGKKEFSEEDILEAQKRAKRKPSSYKEESLLCDILKIDRTDSTKLRLFLLVDDGRTFWATADLENDIDADGEDAIWNAARSKREIELYLGLTYRDGSIKEASVQEVVLES